MSSYINPAPQGDPKATGAYAVAIAAQTGAEGRDSAGNLAVDYVWGSRPLHPDTERVTSAAEPSTLLVAAQWSPAGGKTIYTAGLTTSDITVGDKIVVSGTGSPEWDKEFTVAAVNATSPAGLTIGTTEVTTTYVPGFGVSPDPVVPAGALVTKSVSGNFGGGAGDKSWSKTTKKKSEQLDPALDNHNIATEFWNNFPGYTPNAGFVPQELFRFTSKPGSLYAWSLTPDWVDDEYNTPRGYSFFVNSGTVTTEELDALVELASSGALLAQRVPSFSVADSYGNTTVVQEGFVAGVDIEPDAPNMYGGAQTYTVNIKVAVDNFANWATSPLYAAVGTEIAIGVGAPKEIIATGEIGVDMISATVVGGQGGTVQWYVYGTDWNTLDPDDFVGGYIATDALSDDPNAGMFLNKYHLNRNITKIGSVQFTGMYGDPLVDMYGNSYVIINAATYAFGYMNLSIPSFTSNEGTKIVVIK